jgi:hypothetical protein
MCERFLDLSGGADGSVTAEYRHPLHTGPYLKASNLRRIGQRFEGVSCNGDEM